MSKKDVILNSVLRLVNKEGFYHLNMKKIAQESGLAAGTIYLYFKGKEEMINAIYEQVLNEFHSAVLDAYSDSADVKENFINMFSSATDFYMNNEDKFSFIEQFTFSPFLFKENKRQNFNLLLPLYKLLSTGIKDGVLKKLPLEIMISIIYGSMNTIVKLYFSNKYDLSEKKNKQKFINSIWESIQK